jgi:hypothetical protein
MTEFALPCIRCGKQLRNVFDDVTNQPFEGLAFTSSGHYGGTEFDPMDGSYVELNVCDYCLHRLREKKHILYGRKAKPVLFEGTLVGWVKVKRELTIWTGREEPAYIDPHAGLHVDRDDLEHADERLPEIEWTITPEQLLHD